MLWRESKFYLHILVYLPGIYLKESSDHIFLANPIWPLKTQLKILPQCKVFKDKQSATSVYHHTFDCTYYIMLLQFCHMCIIVTMDVWMAQRLTISGIQRYSPKAFYKWTKSKGEIKAFWAVPDITRFLGWFCGHRLEQDRTGDKGRG